jgi:hypothetical protein
MPKTPYKTGSTGPIRVLIETGKGIRRASPIHIRFVKAVLFVASAVAIASSKSTT